MSLEPITATYAVRRVAGSPRSARVGAERDPAHLLEARAVDDAEVERAPVGHEDVAVVGRDRDVLRHHPDLGDAVDRQLLQVDAVHEARRQPARAAAVVAAFGPEVVAVHRVVGHVEEAVVGTHRPSTGAPCDTPG